MSNAMELDWLLPSLGPIADSSSGLLCSRSIAVVSPTALAAPSAPPSTMSALSSANKPKQRRYCRIPGCSKIVKSQGVCQGHGAKTRMCKMEGCQKQAQGNFDGMCKAHFKLCRLELKEDPIPQEQLSLTPPPAQGESVYDRVLPASLTYVVPATGEEDNDLMPLVAFLKQGFDESRPRGWHRNQERRARGLWPVANPAVQLEGWERELVWLEICALSGSRQASFRHLARAWGRDKGFHMVLVQFICERRGDVERKKRAKGTVPGRKRKESTALDDGGEFDDFDFDEIPLDLLDIMHHADYDLPIQGVSKKTKR